MVHKEEDLPRKRRKQERKQSLRRGDNGYIKSKDTGRYYT